MSVNIADLHSQDELELLRWLVDEWNKYNDEPFPYVYEKVMGSLESFHNSRIEMEVIKAGFSEAFADNRDWVDGDNGRYRYACKVIWKTHEKLVRQERKKAFGKLNVQDFLKELDTLDEGEIQP